MYWTKQSQVRNFDSLNKHQHQEQNITLYPDLFLLFILKFLVNILI